jgi:hypothetical protein
MALHVAKISLCRYSCYRDHCRSRDTRRQIRTIRAATGDYGRTRCRCIYNALQMPASSSPISTVSFGERQSATPMQPDYGVRTKTSGCVPNQALPDPACSSGAVLTTDTSVIYVSGYTQTVRDVPLSEKQQVFAEYGIDWSLHSGYEVDHIISLGSPPWRRLRGCSSACCASVLTRDAPLADHVRTRRQETSEHWIRRRVFDRTALDGFSINTRIGAIRAPTARRIAGAPINLIAPRD